MAFDEENTLSSETPDQAGTLWPDQSDVQLGWPRPWVIWRCYDIARLAARQRNLIRRESLVGHVCRSFPAHPFRPRLCETLIAICENEPPARQRVQNCEAADDKLQLQAANPAQAGVRLSHRPIECDGHSARTLSLLQKAFSQAIIGMI